MKRKIILTEDGSHTIFSEEVNQHYHSRFGALQESKHIFIDAGLCCEIIAPLETVSILEIGFGTGLNALLTYFRAKELNKTVYYETIEPYPLSLYEVALLNYPNLLSYTNANEIFTILHNTVWNKAQTISNNFTLLKRKMSATKATYTPNRFDLVYFDAFSPEVQPELWTKELFESIYNSMKNGSILLTYCSKGSVQKTFAECGFLIEKLSGPIGKREILRVKK